MTLGAHVYMPVATTGPQGHDPRTARWVYGVTLLATVGYAGVFMHAAAGRFLHGTDGTFGTGAARVVLELSYQVAQLGYLYFLWQRWQAPAADVKQDLRWLAPFLIIATISYPNSTDSALYLKYGSMLLRGINPYRVLPLDVPDELSAYVAWNQQSTYGPVALLYCALPSLLSMANVTAGLYLFKLQNLVVHIATALLMRWAVPPQLLEGRVRDVAFFFFAANPLLIGYNLADAHIEGLLCLLVVLAFGLMWRGRLAGAATVLTGAAMVKVLTALWLPLVGGELLRRCRETGKWRPLLWAALGPLALLGLAAVTVLPSPDDWSHLANVHVVGSRRSVYSMIEEFLLRWPAPASWIDLLGSAEKSMRAAISLGVLISAVLRALGRNRQPIVVEIAFWTVLLFAAGTRWVAPWYACVLVPCAPFLAQHPRLLAVVGGYWIGCGFMVDSLGGTPATRFLTSLLTVAPVVAVPLLAPRIRRRLTSSRPPLRQWS